MVTSERLREPKNLVSVRQCVVIPVALIYIVS
jgi:hypothetical protein